MKQSPPEHFQNEAFVFSVLLLSNAFLQNLFFSNSLIHIVWNFYRFMGLLRTSFTLYVKEAIGSKVEVIKSKAVPLL